MSTLEPQTSAKVRLTTTKGAIDIELWAKETPITSRAFLTHVLNGKFDGWEFNRVVDGFLVQIDGMMNQEPFVDEFNTRIRYVKRGIIGSVNLGSRNSNTGKFFITLKETPELQNRNTAFGKVVGDGIYAVLRISEGDKDEDGETPLYPVKVISSEVLIPYFDDLAKEEQVEAVKTKSDKNPKTKKKKIKVKLSLGDEDEEEEEGGVTINIKMKSAHDVLNDKKLAKKEVSPLIEDEKAPESTAKVTVKELKEAEQEKTDRLNKAKEEIEKLKSDLQHDSTLQSTQEHQQEQQQESIVNKQREEYLTKNPPLKTSNKHSREVREMETLKLLQTFQQKIQASKTKESPMKQVTKATEDGFDDFDNLDDSDSDSDIYSHALKFENNIMANEDLLMTIDESRQDELKKKRDNDFYRNVESTSILSKRQKK